MSKKRKLYIYDRDINLLTFLFNAKSATIQQINKEIFKFKNKRVATNRLKCLEKAGLIVGGSLSRLGSHRKVYSVSKKGFDRYLKCDEINTMELKSQSPSHDSTVIDIRNRLLETKIIDEFIFENQLKSFSNYNSDMILSPYRIARVDGAAKLKVKNGIWVGVEYEATYKNLERYPKMLRKYYENDGIAFIICVCKDKQIQNKIKKADKSYFSKYKPSVMYITLNDLMQSEVTCFTTRDNDVITLG